MLNRMPIFISKAVLWNLKIGNKLYVDYITSNGELHVNTKHTVESEGTHYVLRRDIRFRLL